jgi:hypothetical protein
MADDKKKSCGGGKNNMFGVGAIVGILIGVFVGWIIPVPSVIEQKTTAIKSAAKQTEIDARKAAADKLRRTAEGVDTDDKTKDPDYKPNE